MGNSLQAFHSAWASLLIGHALAVREVTADLGKDVPLSLDEYDVLLAAERSPGGRIRYSALADAIVFTRSGVSRVASRLEERGYLRREKCANDGRGAFAVLTAEGREAMKQTWKLYSRAIERVMTRSLSADEAELLHSLLEKLIRGVEGEKLVPLGRT